MNNKQLGVCAISGHTDLSQELFDRYYAPEILKKVEEGSGFVMGCANGADRLAFNLLFPKVPNKVTLYQKGYNLPEWVPKDFTNVVYGFSTWSERDEMMTKVSTCDIAYIYDTKIALGSGTATNIIRRYFGKKEADDFFIFSRSDSTIKEEILSRYPILKDFIFR